jgi:ABC-type amino acid transport substrate-binding protein
MTFHRLRQPLILWLALLIAAFCALAPALSHARMAQASQGATTVEVCTSNGARWVALEDSPAAPVATSNEEGKKSALHLKHCPFCLLGTDRDAPAPHPLVHLFVVLGDHQVPTIRQAFFFSSHYTLAAPARGPPV